MTLIIYCEECTKQERLKDKYAIRKFYSLSEAIQHYNEYRHEIKIELEEEYEDD